MSFIVSDYIPPYRGEGGDGGCDCNCVARPLPLPVTVTKVFASIDPFNPQPVEMHSVSMPTAYQVPNLIYIVFRNGIEQVPDKDFTVFTSGEGLKGFRFVEPFLSPFNTEEYLRLYAIGFSD
jgi:hypothetical protein